MQKLVNVTLLTLFNSNGLKSKKESKEILKDKVFRAVQEEYLDKTVDYLRVSISTLPQEEKKLFEESLREFRGVPFCSWKCKHYIHPDLDCKNKKSDNYGIWVQDINTCADYEDV